MDVSQQDCALDGSRTPVLTLLSLLTLEVTQEAHEVGEDLTVGAGRRQGFNDGRAAGAIQGPVHESRQLGCLDPPCDNGIWETT